MRSSLVCYGLCIAVSATAVGAADFLRRIVFDSPRPLLTARLGASASALQVLVLIQHSTDPNVSPGLVSQHEHRVVGGSNFNAVYNSTFLRESSCNSLPPQADKSNYWHPSIYKVVYNETTNSTQYAALWGQTRIYYNFPDVLNGTGPGTYIEAFPDDFQMVVGSASKKVGGRYMQEDLSIFYYCEQDYANGTITSEVTYGLPDVGCTFLVSKVWFPSCWDGTSGWDPMQTSAHVQYPLLGGGLLGSQCPTGFEHRIPSILVETFHFGPGDFPDGPAGPWGSNGPDVPTYILANGDTTGYGMHADFANGWNTTVLEQVVTECLDLDFDLSAGETCHPLNSTWDYDLASNCFLNPNTSIPAEEVGWTAYLDALPGCNLPWGANGSKPTCPGYVDPEMVPWSRLVGVEQDEEVSLADIAAYGPYYRNTTTSKAASSSCTSSALGAGATMGANSTTVSTPAYSYPASSASTVPTQTSSSATSISTSNSNGSSSSIQGSASTSQSSSSSVITSAKSTSTSAQPSTSTTLVTVTQSMSSKSSTATMSVSKSTTSSSHASTSKSSSASSAEPTLALHRGGRDTTTISTLRSTTSSTLQSSHASSSTDPASM